MRKWYVPVTVLGISSVGLFLLSGRGRQAIRNLLGQFRFDPDTLHSWNESAERELDRIQAALNRIAESIEPRRELGH